MSYLIIVLFALNGQLSAMYLGETVSIKDCANYAMKTFPILHPEVKDAMFLCVEKRTT